ncbi:hypothetical protein U9M48_019270 [Paspalum notatum var. saurae]|uniref:Uncharacterized protein n=1 Tax=Paspalum notatum var. saurae TaxID=547442 RepID=A0AAQ3TFA6_PASNO
MVVNKARVEGCIAEAFILKEISYFSSCKEIDGKVHKDLVQLSEGRVSVRSHGRYDVNGFRFRSAPFEAARPLAATYNSRVMGEEDEEAEGENAGDRQEDEEAGDGQEDAQADEELMGGDGSEEVVQMRGTRRSHYVNPPPIPAAADKKLIKPISDSQWEDMTWDGTCHRRTSNGLLGNLRACLEAR